MSSYLEKQAFSNRLQSALMQAGYAQGPTALAKEFNLRYVGNPISVQSANNWLQGKAIPNQDKLTVLSIWLGVSNQWLRFGDQAPDLLTHSSDDQSNDVEYFLKFKSLTNSQKELIKQLIDELRQ